MEQDRILKMNKLIGLGLNPYYNKFHPNTCVLPEVDNDLANIKETDPVYRIAGRVTQINKMGGSIFIFLKRDNILSQIYVTKQNNEAFDIASLVQLGDIIGARGRVFKTKKEKIALFTQSIVFLTKALRGTGKTLQENNEVTDKELLYRQRYLDMIVNPESLEVLKERSKILYKIRQFLHERDFLEVETRILHHTKGGANAKAFKTFYNDLGQDFYLRVAPELDLKRLMVGGMDKIFEIGKNFRNEGMDKTHNPEFTSLELYQSYSTYDSLITLVQELLHFLEPSFSLFTIRDKTELINGYGNDWESALIDPTFVKGYSCEESPLARPNESDASIVDRFELYINGMEIANGFSELTNPLLQRENFKAQLSKKVSGDTEAMELDEDYCRALEYGMPPTAGVGIGIDRLIMVLLNKENIKDVIAFPHYRKEAV